MKQIFEGLEQGDLSRLVSNKIHIDEFRSKMGRDEDVCVISFKVDGKEPAQDLVSFIEKGYTWVIDADVSSGELDDGDYIVFVEAERENGLCANIMSMMSDISHLVTEDISDWSFKYHKHGGYRDLTEENLHDIVPETKDEYEKLHGIKELDKLKTAAGVDVNTKAPKNEYTESLRIAAGIK